MIEVSFNTTGLTVVDVIVYGWLFASVLVTAHHFINKWLVNRRYIRIMAARQEQDVVQSADEWTADW